MLQEVPKHIRRFKDAEKYDIYGSVGITASTSPDK